MGSVSVRELARQAEATPNQILPRLEGELVAVWREDEGEGKQSEKRSPKARAANRQARRCG